MLAIYLDQNKWIDLAKADAGRPDGNGYVGALAAAREAVKSNKARFPISAAHFKESRRPQRVDQRQRLARLMTELSQGNVLRAPKDMIKDGIRHAVRRAFGLSPLDGELSPFGRGIETAFGFDLATYVRITSPDQMNALRDALDKPAAWIDLLSYLDDAARQGGNDASMRIRKTWVAGRLEDRELLHDCDERKLRRVYAARASIHFNASLKSALAEIGRTYEEWGKLGPDALVEFWYSIPCARAQLDLEAALHFEKSRTPEPDDLNDLEFLGLAIPSCNVVLAHKFWVHHVVRRKLDQAYKTVVLSDLTKLERLLTLEA